MALNPLQKWHVMQDAYCTQTNEQNVTMANYALKFKKMQIRYNVSILKRKNKQKLLTKDGME